MPRRTAEKSSGQKATIAPWCKWYERIHAYLQLIRMQEGTARNTGHILRFAQCQHIEKPEQLMMEELKDSLQCACTRKANLRKQAKGLRQVHLTDCLIDAMTKK
jgi:hypothetical protein